MRRDLLKQWIIDQSFWKRVRHPLAGLILIFSVFLAGIPSVEAQNAAVEASSETASAVYSTATESSSASVTARTTRFPADGIYLYGQSPQPGQLGVDYAVMEVRDRQTVGAFYQMSSSFDCFHGEIGSENVNLTIVNSYEDVSYSYALPIDQTATVASSDDSVAGAVELVGLHSIDTVSEMDMEILATCRAAHAQEI